MSFPQRESGALDSSTRARGRVICNRLAVLLLLVGLASAGSNCERRAISPRVEHRASVIAVYKDECATGSGDSGVGGTPEGSPPNRIEATADLPRTIQT